MICFSVVVNLRGHARAVSQTRFVVDLAFFVRPAAIEEPRGGGHNTLPLRGNTCALKHFHVIYDDDDELLVRASAVLKSQGP